MTFLAVFPATLAARPAGLADARRIGFFALFDADLAAFLGTGAALPADLAGLRVAALGPATGLPALALPPRFWAALLALNGRGRHPFVDFRVYGHQRLICLFPSFWQHN